MNYVLIVTVVDGDGTRDEEYGFTLRIEERLAYNGAVDFTHSISPKDGFTPGSDNSISFEAFNKGNTTIRNAEFNITLPDGMWVNNASNVINVGYMSVGGKQTRTYPISVDESLGGKTYPITIKITGVDMSGDNVSVEKTFYIPVIGEKTGKFKDLSIQNISVPAEVAADQDFTLSFVVKNEGTVIVKNAKVSATLPEGLLNKSTAMFAQDSIAPGESKTYSVTMYAQKASNSSYPIKISVEPLSASDGDAGNIAQYVSVFAKGKGDSVKTPQLMIDQYSYGGNYVMAGKEFFLNLGLYNTSTVMLSNIKITVSSEDGTFVPVDSSNAFFVDSIDSKDHFSKTLHLSAKPAAEQKTTALRVSMAYEDGDGNSFTAEDIVSIPVMQELRLMVDEIVPPYECYSGQMGASQIQFYNMGKTTLNNLKVNAEGDFDIMESNSYYAGNMEGGKSDSYSFTFIPRQVGPMAGKVIFSYEDAAGNPVVYEAPFVFQVVDMPVWEDPYMQQEEEKALPWALIIFGIAVVLLVVGILIWRKIRKIKLHKKLEIQDAEFNAALDLEKDRADLTQSEDRS